MGCEQLVCWTPLDPNGAKIFGFAEYLASLALIIIAWTISEWRYRFHLQTARWPVRRLAFFTIAAVGALTLITDIWRASGYQVPTGNLITPVAWQGLLGGVFLATFVIWATTAFLFPPRFNRGNAHRFIAITYRTALAASPTELDQLAEALESSARRIVRMADISKTNGIATKQVRLAAEMLHAMADPKFCAAAVRSAPLTLQALFDTLRETPGASQQVSQFARNTLVAAITEPASFLHRETADWQSGLAAQGQWVSKCLYGDIDCVDRVPFLFSPHGAHDWSAAEWEAFLRASGHVFLSYAQRTGAGHSQAISSIFHTIQDGTHYLHRLNGSSDWNLQSDDYKKAEAVLAFIDDASIALQNGPVPVHEWNLMDNYKNPIQQLAAIAAKMLVDASNVRSPSSTNWWIQHNLLWTRIFETRNGKGELIKNEIRERVVRMVWAEIVKLEYSPNYVGAGLLGLCLNIGWVRGNRFKPGSGNIAEAALLRLTRSWAIRRFAWLHKYNPNLATSGFSDLMTYSPKRRTIRRTWEPLAFRPVATFTTFEVVPAPPGPADRHLLPFGKLRQEMVSRRRTVPFDIF